MAIGNIGNLLQHFVALRAAQQVVAAWDRPESPIEYIDCFSMAPWEEITGGQPQGFVDLVRRFPAKRDDGDFAATVFLRAWDDRYRPEGVPEHPRERQYPNTAVLLRTGFPEQSWRMRLHENDSTEAGKRESLTQWASKQTAGEYSVAGDWTESKLVLKSPAPVDRPVLVMLDPFRIVPDDSVVANDGGYLPTSALRYLVGKLALNVALRPQIQSSAPLVMTLFSYSDASPDVPDGIVRQQFNGPGWSIDRVRSGPWQGRGGTSWHQGWIVSTGIQAPLLGTSAQDEWDRWSRD